MSTSPEKPELKLNPELVFHLRSLSRIIYYVTEEEDRFLKQFDFSLKKHEKRTWVYNATFGLQQLSEMLKDWESRAHSVSQDCLDDLSSDDIALHLVDKANHRRYTAEGLGVAAAGCAGLAVYLLVRPRSDHAEPAVAPLASSGMAGLALLGRW